MATRKRPGSARRTWARQEAARKRSAPGKRFVGETAGQSAAARRDERKKVARMARAARAAKPAEAARTAGHAKHPRASTKSARGRRPAREPAGAGAALRAAEEEAALRGAEVEPVAGWAGARTDDAAAADTREPPALHLLPGAAGEAEGTVPEPPPAPSIDVSDVAAGGLGGEGDQPALGWALADLARSALGLARTVVGVPFRIALAIPRIAIRAVASL